MTVFRAGKLVLAVCLLGAALPARGAQVWAADAREELKNAYETGSALLKENQLDEAKIYFEKALEINPRFAPALHSLGIVYYQLGYLNQAIQYFEEAAALGLEDAKTSYVVGVAYTRTGQKADAYKAYQRAIALDPGLSQAHHNLGLLYYLDKDYPKSILHLEKALKLDPANTKILFALGMSCVKQKNLERAIEIITELRANRDETKATKLEQLLRPPPELPPGAWEADPAIFEPVLPQPVSSQAPAIGRSKVSITGRMQVNMQGSSPEKKTAD